MKSIRRASGVSFIVPDDVDVAAPSPRPAMRGARARQIAVRGESDRVLSALRAADYEVVDRVALARQAGRATRAPARREPLRVEVPVAAAQSAVLLIEQDGMYRFALPAAKPRAAARTRNAARTVVCEVDLGTPRARRATRGPILDALLGEVRTYVLRFAADLVIREGVKYLERNVRPGFVDMRAKDPAKWRHIESLAALALPADRPARILLFVHGTFSSTVGGYAALRGSRWGNELLDAAQGKYDAIVGFDHPTLSVDPRVNAKALLDALARRKWPSPPAIDIVAHSRGGLVARSLVEELLPSSRLAPRIGSIVLVACTNEGTLLAEPDNWKDLVDLYTNLAVAGCRVLEVFGFSKIAAVVIEEVVKVLGLFVKLLAVSAVTAKRAPGLAAMEPDGAFVKNINKAPPGQLARDYYVVQSDFATRLLAREGPDEFSQRFKLWLADGFVDRLMKKARNDLVVDVSSMGAIDRPARRARATYDFGTNAQVYHTNYFTRPETTQAMGAWLGIAAPPPARVTRSARKMSRSKRLPTTTELARGAVKTPKVVRKTAARNPFDEMRTMAAPTGEARPRTKAVKRSARKPAPREAARKPETCNFHAAMKDAVLVNTNADVGVTISREAIRKALGATSAGAAADVDAAQKLRVRVVPKQNFKVIGEETRDVDPPQQRKPVKLAFTVCATDPGDGEVWVTVQQRHVVLVTLKLFPAIVRRLGTAPRTKSAKAAAAMNRDEPAPIDQLIIEEIVNGSEVRYTFTFLSERLQVRTTCRSDPVRGNREQYVASLYRDIEQRWVSSRRDAADFANELRAFGADLFKELVPLELQRILWQRRNDIRSIQVVSTEPFIPWELVYLTDPAKQRGMPAKSLFLGQMGLIRWVEGVGTNGWPVQRIRIRKGKAWSVVPKYPVADMELPDAEAEAAFLEDKFAAKRLPAESGKVRAFISKPGNFDLLHFVCHGEADSAAIADAKLLMTGRIARDSGEYIEDAFSAKVAARFCNIAAADNAPMVVLNACQVGRQGYRLTSIGGFSEAFLKGGAGAFIGTLWSVGDTPASTFTTELYQRLLANGTLAEATIAGREAARKGRDATWLAYVVYGHPYMTIAR